MRLWLKFAQSSLRLVKILIFSTLIFQRTTGFSSRTLCSRIPGLTTLQRRICTTRPDALIAIGEGASLGTKECQRQFQDHRWNCTSPGGQFLFGHQFNIGSREAAFAYAISSAGVAYMVTKSCSRGNIRNCGCDKSFRGRNYEHTPEGWKWGGCSADIKYGMRFAKKFMDAAESDGGTTTNTTPDYSSPGLQRALSMVATATVDSLSRLLMNLHNNRAGRKAVKNNMVKKCKCHGVSGSCTTRTCWRILPSFQLIGDQLMRRYSVARQVLPPPHRQPHQRVDRMDTSPLLRASHKDINAGTGQFAALVKPRELVFIEQSPNYCERNLTQGSLGTAGRLCNRTLDGSGSDGHGSTSAADNSCDIMCCGRGYNTHQYLRHWQCQCKFVWCCFVECKLCSELAYFFTCK